MVMSEPLRRTQILLEPEQHERLKQLAEQEQRSLSDLVREMLDAQLDQREQEAAVVKQRRLMALRQIKRHREAILERRGGQPLESDIPEMIRQMREERDSEVAGGS
jgi:predicted CopG family antitoxin